MNVVSNKEIFYYKATTIGAQVFWLQVTDNDAVAAKDYVKVEVVDSGDHYQYTKKSDLFWECSEFCVSPNCNINYTSK